MRTRAADLLRLMPPHKVVTTTSIQGMWVKPLPSRRTNARNATKDSQASHCFDITIVLTSGKIQSSCLSCNSRGNVRSLIICSHVCLFISFTGCFCLNNVLFRGLLKKKYAELFEDNKCLICQKTFANSGRLLLHIGVQHDKINEILKSKGLRVLPPFMTTVSSPDSAAVSKTEPMTSQANEPTRPELSVNTKLQVNFEPAPAAIVSNASTINPSTIPVPGPTNPTPPLPTPASLTRPSAQTQENSQQDASTCNYDLECEVCSQKQRSIQLLEQHCCRHFMKELQEQYVALMDGLRCTLCNNVFKQKHSLLLHIGCKHGKVNDILKQKGFAALPCPVNATSNAAMQKQLIQIKKEKMETVKDEEVEQKGNSTLDAILKKYHFTAGIGNKLKKV